MGIFDRLFGNKKQPALEGDEPPNPLPGRNDSCWCGSDVKYKKCHMEKDRLYLARKQEIEAAAKKECSPVFG